MNTKGIIVAYIYYALAVALCITTSVSQAAELNLYGVLEVEHLRNDHPDLNETENDAWVLTATTDSGWTLGYGRYLNSHYDPSILYYGGYTHRFESHDRLSVLAGVALVTGYTKTLKTQYAGMITPPVVGVRYDIFKFKQTGPCKSLNVGATYLVMAIVETKGINLTCEF